MKLQLFSIRWPEDTTPVEGCFSEQLCFLFESVRALKGKQRLYLITFDVKKNAKLFGRKYQKCQKCPNFWEEKFSGSQKCQKCRNVRNARKHFYISTFLTFLTFQKLLFPKIRAFLTFLHFYKKSRNVRNVEMLESISTFLHF